MVRLNSDGKLIRPVHKIYAKRPSVIQTEKTLSSLVPGHDLPYERHLERNAPRAHQATTNQPADKGRTKSLNDEGRREEGTNHTRGSELRKPAKTSYTGKGNRVFTAESPASRRVFVPKGSTVFSIVRTLSKSSRHSFLGMYPTMLWIFTKLTTGKESHPCLCPNLKRIATTHPQTNEVRELSNLAEEGLFSHLTPPRQDCDDSFPPRPRRSPHPAHVLDRISREVVQQHVLHLAWW